MKTQILQVIFNLFKANFVKLDCLKSGEDAKFKAVKQFEILD